MKMMLCLCPSPGHRPRCCTPLRPQPNCHAPAGSSPPPYPARAVGASRSKAGGGAARNKGGGPAVVLRRSMTMRARAWAR